MFSHQKQFTQDPKKITRSHDIFSNIESSEKFDANEDPFMVDRPFNSQISILEESSSLISSHQDASPIKSKASEEEYNNPRETHNKPSPDLLKNKNVMLDCPSFLRPAATVLIYLISISKKLQAPTSRSPWIDDRLLAFFISNRSKEHMELLEYFAWKEEQIEDYQTLLTLFNSDNRLTFLIFSFNLLKAFDTNSVSSFLGLFALYDQRDDLRRAAAFEFSLVLRTIFEARINHSLAHFEYKVGVLGSFDIFNIHLGANQLMNQLFDLFKNLRKTFGSIDPGSTFHWQPQNEGTFDQINVKGSPKYAKRKLCGLLEEVLNFMRESEWVFLLNLSQQNLNILRMGFNEAYDLITKCMEGIWKMIEAQEI